MCVCWTDSGTTDCDCGHGAGLAGLAGVQQCMPGEDRGSAWGRGWGLGREAVGFEDGGIGAVIVRGRASTQQCQAVVLGTPHHVGFNPWGV